MYNPLDITNCRAFEKYLYCYSGLFSKIWCF